MARTLRFDGPSAYLVPEPDADPVPRGQTFTCSEERALEHLTSRSYDCSEVGKSEPTREELNELARKAGVDDPESLANKAAVEAAINEAESA